MLFLSDLIGLAPWSLQETNKKTHKKPTNQPNTHKKNTHNNNNPGNKSTKCMEAARVGRAVNAGLLTSPQTSEDPVDEIGVKEKKGMIRQDQRPGFHLEKP